MSDSVAQPPSAESEALTRYRAASRRRTGTGNDRRRSVVRSMNGRATAGPLRDPQLVSAVWRSLADTQGWTMQLAVWSLANRWPQIVGPQVADHVAVESFDPTPQPVRRAAQGAVQPSLLEEHTESALHAGGTLILRADAVVWQKQLLWNLADLQRRLDLELGQGVVGRIVILGPVERRRSYGPRRVKS